MRRRLAAAAVIVSGGAAIGVGVGVGAWSAGSDPDSECDVGRGPAALVAVDAETGHLLWTALVGEAVALDVETSAAVAAGGGATRAVDLATGAVIDCVADPVPHVLDVPATTTAPEAMEAERADGLVLETAPIPDESRQERAVTVRDATTGQALWSNVVPGFEIHLVGGIVAAIDQTGGDGRWTPTLGPDTRITGYDPRSGDGLWQRAVPGAPWQVRELGRGLVVPTATELISLDPATGDLLWRVDHGSPGTDATFTDPGEYGPLATDTDGTVIVGLIRAREPYRD